MAHQAAALSSPSLSRPFLAHLHSLPFPFPLPCNNFHIPLLSYYFKDLNQDNRRLEKNHRLRSIYFYFNFPLHFSRPKSFWPTLFLYSSLHFSIKKKLKALLITYHHHHRWSYQLSSAYWQWSPSCCSAVATATSRLRHVWVDSTAGQRLFCGSYRRPLDDHSDTDYKLAFVCVAFCDSVLNLWDKFTIRNLTAI